MREFGDEHVSHPHLQGIDDHFALGIHGEGEATLERGFWPEAFHELLHGIDALLALVHALLHERGHAMLEDLSAMSGVGQQLPRMMTSQHALAVGEVVIEIAPGLIERAVKGVIALIEGLFSLAELALWLALERAFRGQLEDAFVMLKRNADTMGDAFLDRVKMAS